LWNVLTERSAGLPSNSFYQVDTMHDNILLSHCLYGVRHFADFLAVYVF